MLTHTLGFPRIGLQRELKKAVEAFWRGEESEAGLRRIAAGLRLKHWVLQRENGIDLVPAGDFSLYDHVLDTSVMLGAIPKRFGWAGGPPDLNLYFRMARGGTGNCTALELSKWFDTNYHYLVPEFLPGQSFSLTQNTLLEHVQEAAAAGVAPKPVLLGPLTYLRLGKTVTPDHDKLSHLEAILPIYEQVIQQLSRHVPWIQIDEPLLALDVTENEAKAFKPSLRRLIDAARPAKVLLATYFGALEKNLDLACVPGLGALHVDLATAPEQVDAALEKLPAGTVLSMGVVNGRNIWRIQPDWAIGMIDSAVRKLGRERVMLGTSCSLLHVPMDLAEETKIDSELRSWMSFAKQKCQELRLLADAACRQPDEAALGTIRSALLGRQGSPRVENSSVRSRLARVTDDMGRRKSTHADRKKKQHEHLRLPLLPTTTIGSFPQTAEIRSARNRLKRGKTNETEYNRFMRDCIRNAVEHQQRLGLDVLVHGEPERNDMVEYFGEQLEGFCFTENGWVQSYGSRCVKPPLIFGDVARPAPMTVEWAKYAQSLTQKPLKGMLTGPVTILCWSFVRDDLPRRDVCRQIALAMRDEVQDLESAGIGIIQMDEAALREGLPLRRRDWSTFLEWAVESFRLATSGVRDETQIHSHMCYSDFNDIIEWIAQMDADVLSIEASRSHMELMHAFERFKYPNDIGPGIYDIHSPRVPSCDEMKDLLREALSCIPADRLWVNPDCGLKTRGWPETLEALGNLVAAAHAIRAERGIVKT